MRQKISSHPTVERILNSFHGGSFVPVEGMKNLLTREFHESVYSSDMDNLLKLFQHYKLVEVTRDRFGFQAEEFRVLDVVRRNPLDDVTGWPRVRIELFTAQQELDIAAHPNEFEKVGHQCREVLISLAQAVYDPQ